MGLKMQNDADRFDVDVLVPDHIQVNKAHKTLWPIHRAHGLELPPNRLKARRGGFIEGKDIPD